MGFLLGAFGKLMAGRRVRELQARMMRVQSRARRVTRQVEQMSKSLETQKKMELNSLSMQQQWANSCMPNMIGGSLAGMGITPSSPQVAAMVSGGCAGMMGQGTLSNQDLEYMAQFNNMKTQMSSSNEMMLAQMKSQIEERYENLNDIMLEPLKMEEDSLQTEKDSLESQLQIAQADYDACKKMEQADAKNLAPNYTGSAG